MFWIDPDEQAVLASERFWSHTDAGDSIAILRQIGGTLVGERCIAHEFSAAIEPCHVLGPGVAVEVQRDTGIVPNIADLLTARPRIDQNSTVVPEEPNGHDLRLAVGPNRGQPDDRFVAELLQNRGWIGQHRASILLPTQRKEAAH